MPNLNLNTLLTYLMNLRYFDGISSLFNANILAAYWHSDSIEIYKLSHNKCEKITACPIHELKPIKTFGKKVLIVGRNALSHTRKRYPPAAHEDIKKAVLMEIEDIFPLKNPFHYSRVFRSTDTYTLVDIWVWEFADYNNLKQVFPFTHLIPEDVMFVSGKLEISIFRDKDITSMLAHSKDGFIGVSSYRGNVTSQQFQVFLKSIARHSEEKVEGINLYKQDIHVAGEDIDSQDLTGMVVRKREAKHPVCLDQVKKLNLSEFRVISENIFSLKFDLILRAVIYVLLAYSLSLYLTARNYSVLSEKNKKDISALSKDVQSIQIQKKEADTDGIDSEVDRKLMGRTSPLSVMEMLAKYLPDGSVVTRIALDEKSLELSLSSKSPLGVIAAIGKVDCIKTVKLKGAPYKDQAMGYYNFLLLVEML